MPTCRQCGGRNQCTMVQEPFGSPKFLTLLSTHATLFVDPGRPSESSPMCFLCVGFWAVKTIAICIWAIFIADAINGAVSSFREYGFPCGLCGSLCTLQLSCSAFASVTIATLGMNGWLGLIHQGLSPWKKRQASLGALTVRVSWIAAVGRYLPLPHLIIYY